jgi:hypothetical protein
MSIPREAYSETVLDDEKVQNYLRQETRSWLGLPVTSPVDLPTVPPDLAARLLRVEEYTQSHRDQWGCWEFPFCASYWAGTLWRAETDERRSLQAIDGLLNRLSGHVGAVA